MPSRGRGPGISGLYPPLSTVVSQIVEESGGRVWVVSGWRSNAKQKILYRKYLNGTGNLAAKPGTSKHEMGDAADLGGDRALYTRLAKAKGLRATVRGEPWHWEHPRQHDSGYRPPAASKPKPKPKPKEWDEMASKREIQDAVRGVIEQELDERLARMLGHLELGNENAYVTGKSKAFSFIRHPAAVNLKDLANYVGKLPQKAKIVQVPGDSKWWVVSGAGRFHVEGKDAAAALVYSQLADWDKGRPFKWTKKQLDGVKVIEA